MKFQAFKCKCNLVIKRFNNILEQINKLETTTIDQKQSLKLSGYLDEVNAKNIDVFSSLDTLYEKEDSQINETELESITNTLSELFVEVKTVLQHHIDFQSSKTNTTNLNNSSNQNLSFSNATSQIRLPKIQLKTFDGNMSQWISFYNLFDTTVHKNTSLSDIEKFQYLLSTLYGEPLNLIKSLPFTNENYLIAYETIVKRYHNTRLLQSLHINFIIDMGECSNVNSTTLRNFVSSYNEHMSALAALDSNTNDDSKFLVTLLMRKFPNFIRTRFESKRDSSQDFPTPKEFITFLENECIISENSILSQDKTFHSKSNLFSDTHAKQSKETKAPLKPIRKTVANLCESSSTYESACGFCRNSGHSIHKCNEFQKLNTHERYQNVKSLGLCINCLKDHKGVCTSKRVCNYCQKRHNSLLHHIKESVNNIHHDNSKHNEISNYNNELSSANSDYRIDQTATPSINNTSTNNVSQHSSHTTRQNNENARFTTLLATAMVKLRSSNGQEVSARALIDSGSSCTIITEHLANLLNVKRKFSNGVCSVNGISSVEIATKGQCVVNILSLNGDIVANNHPVLILNKITSNLPHTDINQDILTKVRNFNLADPTFHKSGHIQMLIGADLFMDIMKENKYSLGDNMPYLLDTSLGFVIMGKITTFDKSKNSITSNTSTTFLTINEDPLYKLMTKFWETEQPPASKCENPENVECENYFQNTCKRSEDGKYTVMLPFKTDPSTQLGQSSEIAKKRFFALERKLLNQPEYKKLYTDFMRDYLQSGHMKLLDINVNGGSILPQTHYFIPHHGVFKENSSTTKLRVVFDASSTTTSGKSLNDLLHAGPKLQNDIASILINFRRHEFVFTTDIKQMFRSINLNSEDHKYQMIYWREEPTQPLSIYKLQTVTYGMTSSPFLANRTILKLIEDEGNKYPLATTALKGQIYVDDIILGADTLHDTLLLQNEVIELFKKGGFHLRKWTANHNDLLNNIPKEFHENPVYFKTPEQPLVSVLGLHWLPKQDCFSYRIKISEQTNFTKRSIQFKNSLFLF